MNVQRIAYFVLEAAALIFSLSFLLTTTGIVLTFLFSFSFRVLSNKRLDNSSHENWLLLRRFLIVISVQNGICSNRMVDHKCVPLSGVGKEGIL